MSQVQPFDKAAYNERVQNGPCFICQLVKNQPEESHSEIYRDEVGIVFLSKYPSQYGYTLVAPIKHRERVTADFSPEEYLALQSLIYRVGEALQKVITTERFYILSLGSQQGNRHVHWHLVPLPPGVPYEEQQLEALKIDKGFLALGNSEAEVLVEKVRQYLL
ncbi:MAG: HIT family protein [Chloroflexi bacterium]|nr:HIT family protein [Chloroflexota bacterium]OJW04367.1 MAG: HIT family protein [Chloroflexi bacterium 54-19]